MSQLVVNTDGGSRGNPGPAGIGVVVSKNDEVIFEQASFIGTATNNEAEYQGVLAALRWLVHHPVEISQEGVLFLLDSKLVVEQLSKNWKIKEPRMQVLAKECWELMGQLSGEVVYQHVPRAENAAADALVNQALDAALV